MDEYVFKVTEQDRVILVGLVQLVQELIKEGLIEFSQTDAVETGDVDNFIERFLAEHSFIRKELN